MDTLKGLVSSANSIRFAHIDGLLPSMNNTLSGNQVWNNKPSVVFKQTFFVGNIVLLQFKCGLTATPLLEKISGNTPPTAISLSDTTTYTDFKIYEYLITYSSVEEFYYQFTTEESTWQSECINVITEDSEYKLIEWSNEDPTNDSFEFDYTTTLAMANVNFMYVKLDLLLAPFSGEVTTYNNQNEETKIKQNLFENYNLVTEVIPAAIYKIIAIAMTHDLFVINDVGYVVPDPPEINPFGGAMELTAEIRLPNNLGFNTDDIGFDCDSITTSMRVDPKGVEDEVGAGQFSIKAGYAIHNIILMPYAGATPTIKMGITVGGQEILRTFTVPNTLPLTPKTINTGYTPDSNTAWTLYYEVLSGRFDIYVTTIMFNSQP